MFFDKYFCLPSALLILVFLPVTSTETVDYKNLQNAKGDKLPNFSFCGYHASEVSLPSLSRPPNKTLSPGSGDQSTSIQGALDEVSAAGGGVVLLEAGTYALGSALVIRNQTTLRGAGSKKTVLTVSSLSNPAIKLGNQTGKGTAIKTALITDDYVPVGAGTVRVDDASGFAVGQHVFIQRAVTAAWVAAMGMDHLVRNGKPQTWLGVGKLVQQPRRIKSITGTAISVDVPLTDAIDSTLMTGQLVAYTPPQQPSEIGLENLSIKVSPTCSGRILTDKSCSSNVVLVSPWTTDSWIRNLDLTGCNNCLSTDSNSSRITLNSVTINRDGATDTGAGSPLDITIGGTQILVANSQALGAEDARSFSVGTQALTPGPNALLNFYAEQGSYTIEPHQRWAHGFLVENSTMASIGFINRGTAGSGHGWSINEGVAWNVNAENLTVQSPPLGWNLCIGCKGTVKSGSNGTFISSGNSVDPSSLFAAQLADRRLGIPDMNFKGVETFNSSQGGALIPPTVTSICTLILGLLGLFLT